MGFDTGALVQAAGSSFLATLAPDPLTRGKFVLDAALNGTRAFNPELGTKLQEGANQVKSSIATGKKYLDTFTAFQKGDTDYLINHSPFAQSHAI